MKIKDSIVSIIKRINDWLKTTKAEVIFRRFMRGFLSGSISSTLTIGVFTGTNFNELGQWLVYLFIAGISGGLTGGFLAVDKYFRWKEEVEKQG